MYRLIQHSILHSQIRLAYARYSLQKVVCQLASLFLRYVDIWRQVWLVLAVFIWHDLPSSYWSSGRVEKCPNTRDLLLVGCLGLWRR